METKKFLRQLECGEQAQQSSSSSSAAVPGGADSSVEAPGKTTHQTPGTVDVAPMTGVQPETQGETEEGEPPYKAARSSDIVMVIDGETFCVPEEDVPRSITRTMMARCFPPSKYTKACRENSN